MSGDWKGEALCYPFIKLDMRLTLQYFPGGETLGTNEVRLLAEDGKAFTTGEYSLRGTYDPASRRIKLDGVKWLDEPSGYAMVGLDGHMASSGQKISGHVPDLFSCTDFEVWRPTQLIG